MRRPLLITMMLLAAGLAGLSQDNKFELDFGTDLMSRYVWRGTQFGGNSPSIQPGISLTRGGLEIGAWGAYSLSGDNTGQEFDLYLSYTFLQEMFTLTLTDYFFPEEGEDGYDYFDFDPDNTGHVLEGTLSFNGTDKVPLSLMVATNFWGADAIRVESDPAAADFNEKTGIQYSTYIELGYSRELENDITLDAFLGSNLNTSMEADTVAGYIGESGYYGMKAGIVNLGCTLSKDVPITGDFSLPLSASLITNPLDKKVYFVFGISL